MGARIAAIARASNTPQEQSSTRFLRITRSSVATHVSPHQVARRRASLRQAKTNLVALAHSLGRALVCTSLVLQLPKLRVASAFRSLKATFVIVSVTIRNLTSSWTMESHSSHTTCRHTLTHSRKMAYPSLLQSGKRRKRRTHGIPFFSSRKLLTT